MVEPDDRSRPGLWMDKCIQEDDTLTYFERMVLAELVYYYKYGDTGCHPSNGHFARKYKVPKSFISHVFKELQRKGRIKCEPIWENGKIVGRITTPIIGGGIKIIPTIKNISGVVSKSYPNKEENKEYKETNKEKAFVDKINLPKESTQPPQVTASQRAARLRREREFDEREWDPTGNQPTAGLPTAEQVAAKRAAFYGDDK